MTPKPSNKNPFNYHQRQWDVGANIDPEFDTAADDFDKFGVLMFEDHIQCEARSLNEQWSDR